MSVKDVKKFYITLIFFILFSRCVFAAKSEHVYRSWLLTVTFNAEPQKNVTLFIEDENDEMYASEEELNSYGLIMSEGNQPIIYKEKKYYKLHNFPGVTYNFDADELSIEITTPTSSLKKQNISDDVFIPNRVDRPDLGGFFNYDLSAQATTDSQQIGGFFTVSLFNQYGVGSYNFLAQSVSDQSPEYIRLNTTWQNDFPEKMRTLRLGDTYTEPTVWSQSVGFGGIQWSSNFSTQPNFVTFPLPSISGASVIPSSVNLLVNNTEVYSGKVNSGPFDIQSIPVVTGAGTVSAVTTDLLGRQQVISVPYYASTEILKKGLSDFSYETGFVRNNYGIDSNNYGSALVSLTRATGLTDRFTEQWHTELLAKQQTAGLSGGYIISALGILSGSVALSHVSSGGAGELASVGFQRQNNNGLSLGSNIQVSTPAFVELGYEPYTFPKIQSQNYIGHPIFNGASMTLSFTLQQNRNTSNASLVSLGYTQPLSYHWSMNVSAITNVGGQVKNQSIFLTLSRMLGENGSYTNIGGALQKEGNQGSFQITKSLPDGSGYGYNVLANPGQNSNYQATFSAQNNVGTYTLTAANQNQQNGLRAEASGAIATLSSSRIYFSREITNSFAVVETGIPNINIYNFNQIVAQTDVNGEALIPDLNAYQPNPIAVDPNQFPMNAEIGATKINIIPYFSSGRLVKFPVSVMRSAQMQLLLASGHPVPSGAEVTAPDNSEIFYVGEDGDFYISGLNEKNTLTAIWDQHTCTFKVDYPKTVTPIPNLGKINCVESL